MTLLKRYNWKWIHFAPGNNENGSTTKKNRGKFFTRRRVTENEIWNHIYFASYQNSMLLLCGSKTRRELFSRVIRCGCRSFFSILQQSREIQIMNAIFRVLWDCVLLHSCSLSLYTIILHFANLSSAIHPTNILFVCSYCSELIFLSCYPSNFFFWIESNWRRSCLQWNNHMVGWTKFSLNYHFHLFVLGKILFLIISWNGFLFMGIIGILLFLCDWNYESQKKSICWFELSSVQTNRNQTHLVNIGVFDVFQLNAKGLAYFFWNWGFSSKGALNHEDIVKIESLSL